MFFKRRGYSIIEWSLVLGIVIAVLALGQEMIKNSLERKSLLTAQYIIWNSLGENMEDEDIEDYDSSRSKTLTEDTKKTILLENHSGKIKSVIDPAGSTRTTYSVTASVSEEMLGKGSVWDPQKQKYVDLEQDLLDRVQPFEYSHVIPYP